jgi:hypothetical protein
MGKHRILLDFWERKAFLHLRSFLKDVALVKEQSDSVFYIRVITDCIVVKPYHWIHTLEWFIVKFLKLSISSAHASINFQGKSSREIWTQLFLILFMITNCHFVSYSVWIEHTLSLLFNLYFLDNLEFVYAWIQPLISFLVASSYFKIWYVYV